MEPVYAIVLGVVQGLTEFLPVSSSGHLVLFQNLFGLNEPELLFDICLHVGTLAAVLAVFYKEILSIINTLVHLPSLSKTYGGYASLFQQNPEVRIAVFIIVGSIPTAIIGLMFKEIADRIFGSVTLAGLMLIVTGTLLWLTRNLEKKGRDVNGMKAKDALIIGLVQGLAILPGISRSGSTIATALFLGVDREVAARYSFLLSIPAIAGALVLGLDSPEMASTIPWTIIFAGTLVSAVIGWAALKLLIKIVKKGQFHRFAPYCWAVGLVVLGVNIL